MFAIIIVGLLIVSLLLCYSIMKMGSDADDESERIYRNLMQKQDSDNE